MPEKTYTEALNEALHQEMERDETVIVIGEDVAGGAGTQGDDIEAIGGIFGVCAGLGRKFGKHLEDGHHEDFYQFIDAALEMYN